MPQSPVPITPTGTANNRLRHRVLLGRPGQHRILTTQGIQELGPSAVQEVLHQILAFRDEDFRVRFEPYGDRDFIVIQFQGKKIWAKIDHYDLTMKGLSPDPTDDAVTVRAMTLMRPDEY
jgi:hypothetical protein